MYIDYIDEIDQAPLEEVRTLMNLSAEVGSKLIVLGTGNNSSLIPELRLFVEPLIVIFEEFTKDQLQSILQDRTFGGIVNANGIGLLIAMKLLGRCSGLFLITSSVFFWCFTLNMLVGDARSGIQILCQSLEYAVRKAVKRNPNFWKGNIIFLTQFIYEL